MKQILCCLRDMHNMHICHRDLKPDNILMDNDFNVKICDFGSAKVIDDGDETNISRIVARCYRPPEIALASSDYTSAIDMWTVGCILYELLTLQTAFEPQSDGYIFFEQCQLLGIPNEKERIILFEHCKDDLKKQLNDYCENAKVEKISIYSILPAYYNAKERTAGAKLVDGLLCWSPRDRMTADACLKSDMLNGV